MPLPFSKEHIHNPTEDIYKREVKIKSDYSTLVVKNVEEISVYHTQEFLWICGNRLSTTFYWEWRCLNLDFFKKN